MNNPLSRLTGVPKVVVAPGPPEAKPVRRRTKIEEETANVEPVPTTDKAAQLARLQAEADALAALSRRVESVKIVVPELGAKRPEGTVAERWIETWNARLVDPRWISALCLPPGSVGLAELRKNREGTRDILAAVGIPLGASVNPAGFKEAVNRHFGGRYEVHRAAWRGPRGELVVLAHRQDAEDPLDGYGKLRPFLLNVDDAQSRVFHSAGLAKVTKVAKKEEREKPQLVAHRIGRRGPEFDVRPHLGQSVDDYVKAAGKLATAFRAPNLAVTAAGELARISLNTKEIAYPREAPLSPNLLVRPRTEDERIVAARNIVLPIGITAEGEPILIDLLSRPHTMYTGTSGSGKSTALVTAIRALCVQGAKVVIADFKGDKRLRKLYLDRTPGVAHLSVEEAGIARTLQWFSAELERRKTLSRLLPTDLPEPWDPVVLVIDEWGAGLKDRLDSTDKRAVSAGAAMVHAATLLMAQGRSFGMYFILSSQDCYANSMPGTLVGNAKTRVVLGAEDLGEGAPLPRLFRGSQKEAAIAASKGIKPGAKGRGIVADDAGNITQFMAFHNTGDAEEAMLDALRQTPRQRRFAWKFPTSGEGSEGDWKLWSLWDDNGKLHNVKELPTVALDDRQFNAIPEHKMYDPGETELYVQASGGIPTLDANHDYLGGP